MRGIRTKSLRSAMSLAFLGVWISAFILIPENDAAGQAAVLSTLAASGAGSGGDTSFGSKGSVETLSRSDPIALMLLGLGLIAVTALRRRRFKDHPQTSRGDLLRPAGSRAGVRPGDIRSERHSGRRSAAPRQAAAPAAFHRPLHQLCRASHRPAMLQGRLRSTGSMPDVLLLLFNTAESGQEIGRPLENHFCARRCQFFPRPESP